MMRRYVIQNGSIEEVYKNVCTYYVNRGTWNRESDLMSYRTVFRHSNLLFSLVFVFCNVQKFEFF